MTIAKQVLAFALILIVGRTTAAEPTPWISSAPPTPTRELAPAPPIGIHPRIFFGPDDLPDIRKRASTTKMGQFYVEQIEKYLNGTIRKDGAKEAEYYRLLSAGADVPKLQAVPYAAFGRILMYEAFAALLANDEARGRRVAAAIVNYARNYHYDQAEYRDDSWNYLFSHDVNKFLAIAYDLAYNWMDDAGRATVRAEIATMVYGREPYGWRQPRWQRAYNHVGDHQFIVWANLAIEGEDGYQPELTRKTMEVVRDYANLGLHPSGFGAESLTYTYFGFESTSRCLLAFARREQNMFADTNFRFYKNYLLHNACQFDPSKTDSHGDGDRGPVRLNPMLKYMYPDDPQIDCLHRLAIADIDRGETGWGYFGYQWFFGVITALDPAPDGPAAIPELGLSLSFFCPERGELIARTGWGPDDLKFDLECREDITVLGHQHSSRGSFYLQALGRDWVVDRGYHQAESHRHSLVHIDGVGQSGWPCGPGKVVAVRQSQVVDLIACDAKYAYDWSLRDGAWLQQPGQTEGWTHVTLPYRDRFPPAMTAELPLKERRGDGAFGHFPDSIWRREYNPVQRAFRTGALIRGAAPYVLVFDDVRKDDDAHLYDWIMQVADDLECKSVNGRTLVLGAEDSPNEAGQPRLLVRLLDVNAATARSEWGPTIPHDRATALRLERYVAGRDAYEGGSTNSRVVIPAISVDPRYRVLLFPFRQGDPEPITTFANGSLLVRVGEQEDIYQLGLLPDGRTVFGLTRNGERVLALPEAAVALAEPPVAGSGSTAAPTGLLASYSCDALDQARPLPDTADFAGLVTGELPDATGLSQPGQAEVVKLVNGVRGQAIWLDGKWSDVRLPMDLRQRTDRQRQQVTVSLWIRPDAMQGAPFYAGGHRGLGIEFANGKKFRVYTAEDWWAMTAPLPEYITKRWTHIVLIRDGAVARLFMDGKLAVETVRESNRWEVDAPEIGSRGYRGAIDEIRIYNEPLDAAAVAALYEQERTQ